mmetsp:Transcript_4273/g.7159  ORF Transcript_4273/g.7159 Transcript_4273/m.7159 type:complete len:213 (+) Transcript_4273:566-1204(+)
MRLELLDRLWEWFHAGDELQHRCLPCLQQRVAGAPSTDQCIVGPTKPRPKTRRPGCVLRPRSCEEEVRARRVIPYPVKPLEAKSRCVHVKSAKANQHGGSHDVGAMLPHKGQERRGKLICSDKCFEVGVIQDDDPPTRVAPLPRLYAELAKPWHRCPARIPIAPYYSFSGLDGRAAQIYVCVQAKEWGILNYWRGFDLGNSRDLPDAAQCIT